MTRLWQRSAVVGKPQSPEHGSTSIRHATLLDTRSRRWHSRDVDLASLGWNQHFAGAFAAHAAAGLVAARVAAEHKHAYVLLGEDGEFAGELRGRLLQHGPRADLPAVGDWVAVERVPAGHHRRRIHAVLPRRTWFSRRAAGERETEQIVAANIDTVFLVNGLDADFNLRRMERYLALTRTSGALPVIVLNKLDACPDPAARHAEVTRVAGDCAVHVVSAERGDGVETLAPYLVRGATVALLGSSGVGKSTLVNRLLGAPRQTVAAVNEDHGRGRHTTTRRELIPLPGGALLIDTPGMRELHLWSNARAGLRAVFPEVMALAEHCRFRDCRHAAEPGCAVRAALTAGELAADRLASFEKLRAELEALDAVAAPKRKSRGRITGRRIMRG